MASLKPLILWQLKRFCRLNGLDSELIDSELTYGENLTILKNHIPPSSNIAITDQPRSKQLIIIPRLIPLIEEKGKIATYRTRPLKTGDLRNVYCSRFPNTRCPQCRGGKPHMTLKVTKVEQIDLNALGDEDAWLVGVKDIAELRELLGRWYPDQTNLYRNFFEIA